MLPRDRGTILQLSDLASEIKGLQWYWFTSRGRRPLCHSHKVNGGSAWTSECVYLLSVNIHEILQQGNAAKVKERERCKDSEVCRELRLGLLLT